jgi:hypothetical protein
MKTILISLVTAAILVALSGPANAQYPWHGDRLVIFSDEGLTDSTLTDDAPRTVSLYVVHRNFDYGTGVRFATAADPGFTGVWLSETSSHYTMGKSTTDISVSYGLCRPSPVVVLTMVYQMFGTSESCSKLSIAPAAGFSDAVCFSHGGCFYENACQTGALHVNCPVATESTTWGRVKALYRN